MIGRHDPAGEAMRHEFLTPYLCTNRKGRPPVSWPGNSGESELPISKSEVKKEAEMHIRSLSLIAMTGILLSLSPRLAAQTAPCGIETLKLGGEKEEVRFIPAPMEYVQESVKRALPSVAADLKTDQPGHIEAKIDVELWDAMKNRAFGSEGMKSNGAIGALHIDLATASQDGAQGTTVKISFSKHGLGNGSYGGPLADETECLVKLLSPIDPTAHPTGAVSAMPQATAEEVNVKAGTPV